MNSQTDRPDVESADIDDVSEDTDTLETLDADSGEVSDEIEALKAKADENWDRYLRAAAEVEQLFRLSEAPGCTRREHQPGDEPTHDAAPRSSAKRARHPGLQNQWSTPSTVR